MLDFNAIMTEAMKTIREQNPINIVLRRGSEDLEPQEFRIARLSKGSESVGDGSRSYIAPISMLGEPNADIQRGDRFTYEDRLYQVLGLRPHDNIATRATADIFASQ